MKHHLESLKGVSKCSDNVTFISVEYNQFKLNIQTSITKLQVELLKYFGAQSQVIWEHYLRKSKSNLKSFKTRPNQIWRHKTSPVKSRNFWNGSKWGSNWFETNQSEVETGPINSEVIETDPSWVSSLLRRYRTSLKSHETIPKQVLSNLRHD